MRQLFSFIIILIFSYSVSYSQIGGRGVYEFLNLNTSARIAALGGKQISLYDGDVNMAYYNPSLVDNDMSRKLAINYVNYFAGINWGNTSYLFHNNKIGNVVIGITYLNYGEFIKADETGYIDGNFTASDYTFYASYSRKIDSNIIVGITVKPVYSQYESYNSFGIASDLGITYHNPEKLFTAAFVMRNIGTQIKPYNAHNYEPLPFELQLGVTQRLRHAPFRFSLMLHNLQRFDYTYTIEKEDDLIDDPFFDDTNEKSKMQEFSDKLFRHFIAGVEFIPTKSFVFRLGYNYQRLKEMQIENKAGTVGISWGFGLLLTKYHINFSRATYHMAGASNHFSITANLSELKRL